MGRAGGKRAWCQLPLEPAAPWMRLSLFAQALGTYLFQSYEDSVIQLDLAEIEDVFTRRLAPRDSERKAARRALREIVDEGLIVSVEGGVRLLYSRETYAAHHAQGGRKVVGRSADRTATIPGPSPNGPPTVPQPSQDHPPMVPRPYPQGLQTVPDNDSESLDRGAQRERERERETERENARATVLADGPSEGEPEDRDFATVFSRLKSEFSLRWIASGQPGLWSQAGHPAVEKLAAWVQSMPGSPREVIRQLLDVFFANDWAKAQHFPVDHLSRYPLKYFAPRTAPAAVDTIDGLRALQQAAIARNDIPALKALNARVEALKEGKTNART